MLRRDRRVSTALRISTWRASGWFRLSDSRRGSLAFTWKTNRTLQAVHCNKTHISPDIYYNYPSKHTCSMVTTT